MKDSISIEQIQAINEVMTQKLQLNSLLSPKIKNLELEDNVKITPLPILIPYQSQLILNQHLLQKVIDRLVRSYIEFRQQINDQKLLDRDYLKGLIRLSYSELGASEIELSLLIKEIGRMIRDLGDLNKEEYQEATNGNIIFSISDYSRFIQNISKNKVGKKIQKQIETNVFDIIEEFLNKNVERSPHLKSSI